MPAAAGGDACNGVVAIGGACVATPATDVEGAMVINGGVAGAVTPFAEDERTSADESESEDDGTGDTPITEVAIGSGGGVTAGGFATGTTAWVAPVAGAPAVVTGVAAIAKAMGAEALTLPGALPGTMPKLAAVNGAVKGGDTAPTPAPPAFPIMPPVGPPAVAAPGDAGTATFCN